ncbi:MAG: hypothetical protein ACPGLV_14910 [Bacteroidia bacterium]
MEGEAQLKALDVNTYEKYFILKIYNPEQAKLNGFDKAKRKTSDGEETEWVVLVEFGPQKGADVTELFSKKHFEVLIPTAMCINPEADEADRRYGLHYFDKNNARKKIHALHKNDFYRKIGPQITSMRQFRELAAGGKVEFPNKKTVENPEPKSGVVTSLLNKAELRRYPPNCADVVSVT